MLSLGDIVRKTQPSLFWSMRGLKKAKREAIYTLFAFCRHLNQLIHADMTDDEKKELLNSWQEELNNIYDKKVPATNIGRKIYKNCLRFNLPKQCWLDILHSTFLNTPYPLQAPEREVFEQYVHGASIMPFQLALMIIDNTHPKVNMELAHNLGLSTMITYILRDIKEDAEEGYFYIPQDILQQSGVKISTPHHMIENNNLPTARKLLSEIADKSFAKSSRLLSKMNKTDTQMFRLINNISRCYFEQMQRRGWEIMSPKPKISWLKNLKIINTTLFK